jgi:hypothetical protein
MSKEEIFTQVIYCRTCKRKTDHDIDRDKQIDDEYGIDYCFVPTAGTSYQIVVCRGCKTKSFRILRYRQKSHYEFSLDDDDIFSYEDELYPKDIPWHEDRISEYKEYIPSNIHQLYHEVLSAIQEEAYILAGIGLRSIIEGICEDRGMKGNLLKQIENLAKESYISSDNKDILHGIRFMGNDAAHDLTRPKIDSIKYVLKVAEHLIESIYLLKTTSKNVIEIPIKDYGIFENNLLENIDKFEQGEEKSLREWLEPKYRLYELNIQVLENKLIEKIKSKTFNKLSLGRCGGKDNNIQFYRKE